MRFTEHHILLLWQMRQNDLWAFFLDIPGMDTDAEVLTKFAIRNGTIFPYIRQVWSRSVVVVVECVIPPTIFPKTNFMMGPWGRELEVRAQPK